MKVKKCKSTLLYSTLVLCLWGGFPQVRAASFESFAIEQQSNKVIGTATAVFRPQTEQIHIGGGTHYPSVPHGCLPNHGRDIF